MELDPNLDGFPQVKQTPHLVFGMTKGEMPAYLASFISPNQKQKGLLVITQTFLALEYGKIAPAVMSILNDSQHIPNHILQAFFVFPGAFESTMQRASIIPQPNNHGFHQASVIYPQPPQPSPTMIPPTPPPHQTVLQTNNSAMGPNPPRTITIKGRVESGTNSLPSVNELSDETIHRGAKQSDDPIETSTPSTTQQPTPHQRRSPIKF